MLPVVVWLCDLCVWLFKYFWNMFSDFVYNMLMKFARFVSDLHVCLVMVSSVFEWFWILYMICMRLIERLVLIHCAWVFVRLRAIGCLMRCMICEQDWLTLFCLCVWLFDCCLPELFVCCLMCVCTKSVCVWMMFVFFVLNCMICLILFMTVWITLHGFVLFDVTINYVLYACVCCLHDCWHALCFDCMTWQIVSYLLIWVHMICWIGVWMICYEWNITCLKVTFIMVEICVFYVYVYVWCVWLCCVCFVWIIVEFLVDLYVWCVEWFCKCFQWFECVCFLILNVCFCT